MPGLFFTLCAALLAVVLTAAPPPARAAERPPDIEDEGELTEGVRSGRLKRDELVRRGKELSYFQKLKLYYYAQKLGPYFEGVEETIRDLARTPPQEAERIETGRRLIYEAMRRARQRLAAAQRPQFELEWRRGLTGLIYLDFDWRERIAEQKKDEIKNPYDLAALMDCLDAHLRGLEQGGIAGCPAVARPKHNEGKDAS